MSPRQFIVDGYNVLHALFPGAEKEDLFARREWLAERLASVVALEGASAVLVFDGHGPQITSRPVRGAPVEVVFAGGRFTADTLIARRIAERPVDLHVTVVSGDQEVQRAAARAGVSRMTLREFSALLASASVALDSSTEVSRIPTLLEHKVDGETLRKLEELRRQT